MQYLRRIPVMLCLLVSQATLAQGWITYTGDEDDFRIRAPGEFMVEETEWVTEYSAVMPARIYSLERAEDRYFITVVDYTSSREEHKKRDRAEAECNLYWEIDIRGSVAYAAAKLRTRGGEVNFDAYHYIDRIEGHQLQVANDDGTRTYAAIYLHDSRLYILEATIGPRQPPPIMFQQSLEFLDDEGNRLRYENIADAIKVRDAVARPDEENEDR